TYGLVLHYRCNADFFGFKMLIVFALAQQDKGVGARGRAFFYGGNHIGTAEPVSFRQVGLRPLRRMIWMRMIKTYDVETLLRRLALNGDQFFGIDVVAVVGTIVARVATANHLLDGADCALKPAQQNAATLIGIGFFSMVANGFVIVFPHDQHKFR